MTHQEEETRLMRVIGRNIRAARKQRGMSRKALGGALGGLSSGQIQKYESALSHISAPRLQRVAEALQTDPAALLHERPPVEE